MVRVAGLKRRIATGLAVPTNVGRAPLDVLADISEKAHELQARHARAFRELVMPALDDAGIHIETWDDLDDGRPGADRRDLLAADLPGADAAGGRPRAPVPLHLGPLAQPRRSACATRRPARSSSPASRCRRCCRGSCSCRDDASGQMRFIPLEDLIANHLGDLFPGMEILDAPRVPRHPQRRRRDRRGRDREPHPGPRAGAAAPPVRSADPARGHRRHG